jgi:hypothetical protein
LELELMPLSVEDSGSSSCRQELELLLLLLLSLARLMMPQGNPEIAFQMELSGKSAGRSSTTIKAPEKATHNSEIPKP